MALTSVKVPKYLAIYYGWPSLVENSQGNVTAASNWFGKFDLIVFGDGIWKTTHGDHLKTQTIIRNLIALGKKVCGYVDLGVSTQNLNETQMREAVDGWSTMGANGIFWDDAGFDYGVTRQRQSNMIQYCHSKNMNVIMNAWNPDDIFSGANVQLNSNDIYLLESYLISNGKYLLLTDWKIKANKCANYQKLLGVKMACLSTPNTNDQFTQAWFGTAMYNFDYFQATDITYSASNNKLAFTANPSSSYGSRWQNDTISSNTKNTYFSRSTESWTLSIAGDGASWGYGTFTRNG
ncbi:unnamed protein product [Rotaria sp. Silwood1]|nr:unnamed protein product [Rotaria sp. Silwood1]CAF3878196.1 unnamed protein product [Rotaria sp. Silwood1]CAF3944145.1 unnamed protein product [Rotaria sp. Silwood1]CAF4659279.1 unnamed protein product [Rotaria sp. Silwood1]CAF4740182.1 unnamed protein product [Rotaria sp. Silwood1]